MTSDSVAQDQIKAFVGRILRLKGEAKDLNRDIREVYAEAKGNGFDKTVLGKLVSYVEKRANGANDLLEAEALFDLYLSAYDGASHTHAREDEPEHDADGVIIEPEAAMLPQTGGHAPLVANTWSESSGQSIGAAIATSQALGDDCSSLTVVPARSSDAGPECAEGQQPTRVPVATPPVAPATVVTEAGDDRGADSSPAAMVVVASNVTQLQTKKRWTFNDPAHRDCLDPGMCGGFSNLKLCQKCREASETGQVA